MSRIDVHTHVIPPVWGKGLSEHGGDPSGWTLPEWTPQTALDFMDSNKIGTSVLSLTAPGVCGWKGQARLEMARKVNEYTADVVQKHPKRFGNFLTLPLSEIEGALKEIEYGFDHLKADGVVLLSNYEGMYLGDSALEPVWKELNKRSAVVFVHPNDPSVPGKFVIPGPVVDYPFDTTRSAAQMVYNGVMDRYQNIKVILAHAGGFLPFAVRRFAELIPVVRKARHEENIPTANSLMETFRKFYFDTALSSSPEGLPSLLAFAKPGHVLFGSDNPYASRPVSESFVYMLDNYKDFKDGQYDSINQDGALELFPRLKA
ncbi:amidohydrolase [Acetobacteraceae bacterium]|nr:amidohydrolase [Acetobacteraceae bacterium]